MCAALVSDGARDYDLLAFAPPCAEWRRVVPRDVERGDYCAEEFVAASQHTGID